MDRPGERDRAPLERQTGHRQDDGNEDGPQSVLPRSLLADYQAEMQRRLSVEAVLRERQARRIAFWVVFALLAGLTVWRLVIAAVDLTAYLRLSIAGTTTEATVLRKRTEGGSVEDPDRFIITYGFWAGSSAYIQREEVSGDTFDALGVEGTVDVIYLWRQPQLSRIAREHAFPWRLDAIALTVVCVALFLAGRAVLRERPEPASSAPADARSCSPSFNLLHWRVRSVPTEADARTKGCRQDDLISLTHCLRSC